MAAVDYFLKIAEAPGESKDDKHPGEIDIESFSWGQTQQGTSSSGGGGGAGKVVAQDMHFVSKMSKASPVLFIHCSTGAHFKNAILTARKAGGGQQEYLKVTMDEVLVTSYQTGGSAHGDIVPTDQFSLNFAKLEIIYKEQKPDGSLGAEVKQKYDFKANKKI
jgi:type VI secretion system secreted protein Hcp